MWALCSLGNAFFFNLNIGSFRVKWSSGRADIVSDLARSVIFALFKIKSCQARFLRFGVNVVQYNQISQFRVGACTDFGQIRPDDTD